MKKLIIITGDLATGKSHMARLLSERYSVKMYCKDTVKERLCEKYDYTEREQNRKLSKLAVSLMTYGFFHSRKSGEDLIMEANFRTEELLKIDRIASSAGYDVLNLVLRADVDIIYERFLNRIENENRHPAHTVGFDGYESFKEYIGVGREQKTFGRTIEIWADDFSYTTDDELLAKIDSFMEKK